MKKLLLPLALAACTAAPGPAPAAARAPAPPPLTLSAPAPRASPPPPDPEDADVDAGEGADAAPVDARFRVLFRGAGLADGAVPSLQGVDAAHDRAYVTVEPCGGGHFEVVTADLASGTASAWTASDAAASGPAFHALDGDFARDLSRYADMVEATGPFVERARDYAGPHLAVTSEWIAFEGDHDTLSLARRDGSDARRLGAGTRAAYLPAFSPDGSRVAFDACVVRSVIPPGAFYECPYRVYVATIGSPAVAYDVPQPGPPTFALDGQSVYAVSRDVDHDVSPEDRGGCADRIDLATDTVEELACSTDMHAVALATSGDRALFHGTRGAPGSRTRAIEWLALPSGDVRGAVDVERATDDVSYGGGDWAVVSTQDGLVAVSLKTGRLSAPLADPPGATTRVSNQWKDDHTVYALRARRGEHAWEVLAVDARAMAGDFSESPPEFP